MPEADKLPFLTHCKQEANQTADLEVLQDVWAARVTPTRYVDFSYQSDNAVATLASSAGNQRRSMTFETKQIGKGPDLVAPDGSEVRVLCQVAAGSLAQFTLPARAVSKAMAHQTVEEIWLFISGNGRMWRQLGDRAETVEVGPGTSVTIPVGTHFQFRSDGDQPLTALGATMPAWPGKEEAYSVQGLWQPTV